MMRTRAASRHSAGRPTPLRMRRRASAGSCLNPRRHMTHLAVTHQDMVRGRCTDAILCRVPCTDALPLSNARGSPAAAAHRHSQSPRAPDGRRRVQPDVRRPYLVRTSITAAPALSSASLLADGRFANHQTRVETPSSPCSRASIPLPALERGNGYAPSAPRSPDRRSH